MGFTVAAIVNEPAPMLRRFVRWYQAQGATAVQLFFDDPACPDLPEFAALPGVTAVACTPDFWQGLGLSPEARFTRRQNAALTDAYRGLDAGWLLNVDADELMYFAGTTLAARLADVPPDVPTIRVASAEMVAAEAPGIVVRLQMPRATVNAIHGEMAGLFRPRFGLIGHADGKSFHRAGQPGIRLRQHWAEDAAGNEVTGLRWGAAEGAYLLHDIAPDYDRWRAKLEWRLGAHGFPEPIKQHLRDIETAEPDPERAYRRLYDHLHSLTPAQMAALRQAGALLELPADFAAEAA